MFNWFKPKCPIPKEDQQWVEECWLWFVESFGVDRALGGKVVEPTHEYFPFRMEPTEDCARNVFDSVCGLMGIDRENVEFKMYSEKRHTRLGAGVGVESSESGTVGLYQESGKPLIQLEESTLDNPIVMISTLAYELSHYLLLHEERVDWDYSDMGSLADVVAVFSGFGIFMANSIVQYSQWSEGGWSGWSSSGVGYLDEPTAAYALAYFAYQRGDGGKEWAKHLDPTVRSLFKKNLKFILSDRGKRGGFYQGAV